MRMLGRYRLWAYRFDGAAWGWRRLDSNRPTKYRKLAEKRTWHRETVEELRPFPDDNDLDPGGDCRHGCNGDCETSGSDRCNFTCHDPEIGQFWRDLNDHMEDPTFRHSYIKQSLEIQKMLNDTKEEDG